MPKANFLVKVILMARCARQAQGPRHRAQGTGHKAQGTRHRAQGKNNKRKLIFSLRLIFQLRLSANFSYIFPLKIEKVIFCT